MTNRVIKKQFAVDTAFTSIQAFAASTVIISAGSLRLKSKTQTINLV